MKNHKFIVEKTSTGYSAYAKDDHINVGTTGKSITELKSNILEAFNLLNDHNGKKPITAEQITIELDLPQFFEYYPINAKALAERIGMNIQLLNQYIKGQKHPGEKQVEKIISGLKEMAREILELEFA